MSQPHSDGYLSTPLDGQGDPVLILHPSWGLKPPLSVTSATGWRRRALWFSRPTSITARWLTPYPKPGPSLP